MSEQGLEDSKAGKTVDVLAVIHGAMNVLSE